MPHGFRGFTVTLSRAPARAKEFCEIAEADHNDTYLVGGQAYFDKLLGFVNVAVGAKVN